MKDPAFLFYPADWLIGCSDLTMEERGQYITLLCLQHQKGHLSEKTIGLILGCHWDKLSSDVRAKFKTDENGCYYNERLEYEIERRAKHVEKQKENGQKGGAPKGNQNAKKQPKNNLNSIQKQDKNKPLETETINETEIVVETEKGGMGEKTKSEETFEIFRKAYPGTKQGLKTEFENFQKKHQDWPAVIPLLFPALENQQKWRTQAKAHNAFIPEWPMLGTWINNRRWEQELNFNFEKNNDRRTNTNHQSNADELRRQRNEYATAAAAILQCTAGSQG